MERTFAQIMYISSLEPSRFRNINNSTQTATYLEPRKDTKYAQWKASLLGMKTRHRKPCFIVDRASTRVYSIWLECQRGPPFEKMDSLALLFVYIERGNYNPVSRTSHISATGLPHSTVLGLQKWLYSKFNIETTTETPISSSGKVSLFLRLDRKNTDCLLNTIFELFEIYDVPITVVRKMGHRHPMNAKLIEESNRRRKRMRNRTIEIEPDILEKIVETAKKTTDREIFGLLYGDSFKRIISDFVTIPFPSFDGGVIFDQLTLDKVKEPKDKECLGWFHSHIEDDLTPSPRDIATHKKMFGKSYHIMMIVSAKSGMIRTVDHIWTEPRLCAPKIAGKNKVVLPDTDEILKLQRSGKSPKEMAEFYGVTPSAIRKALKKDGYL